MINDKELASEYRAYEIMSELLKKWLSSDKILYETKETIQKIEDEVVGQAMIMSEIYTDAKSNE